MDRSSHRTWQVARAVGLGLPLLVGSGIGMASGAERAVLHARLTPDELTRASSGVPARARGSFRATFWPYGSRREQAHFWLTTRALSSRTLTAHIHTGAPGRDGPVLITLCTGGRCSLSGGGVHVYPVGFVQTMRTLGAYVDVRTHRNRRGELRGQIVIDTG